MLVFAEAKKYVAGANREYMEEIIDIYNKVYGQENHSKLKNEVFSFV
jgi:hypothetical protein